MCNFLYINLSNYGIRKEVLFNFAMWKLIIYTIRGVPLEKCLLLIGKVKNTFHIFCDFFRTSATEFFQIHETRKIVYLVFFFSFLILG